MALSIRIFILPRNTYCLLSKNKYSVSLPFQNSLRYLRGSRYGRIIYRTEAKFQELLNNLSKQTENSVVNITEIPETVVKSGNSNEPLNEKSTDPRIEAELADPQNITIIVPNDGAHEEIVKRLEQKITPLKNLTYAKQLERKYNKSLGLLRLFGEKLRQAKVPITTGSDKLPCPVELMLPSPTIEAYRNQDEFSIGTGIDGNPKTVGFYLEDPNDKSKTICVGPDSLVTIRENHKKFAKDFERYIRNSPLPASHTLADGGYWKSVQMKSNSNGDLMGIITFRRQKMPLVDYDAEKLKLIEYFSASGDSYNLKSLYFQRWREKKPMVEGLKTYEDASSWLFGEKHLVEHIDNVTLRHLPGSYFLPNTSVTALMYSTLQKMCRMHSTSTVLDIFCGTGISSLIFAPRVKKCIGVDNDFNNAQTAKLNAVFCGMDNVEFFFNKPEEVINDINVYFHDDLIAVISPSRADVSPALLKFLRRIRHLNKIIYITTKPRLVLDNFVRLCKPAGSEAYLGKPFVPLFALPVDLLPQTDHYAMAVVFQRF